MTNFKDKIVLITGANSGIGRAIALHFARSGAKVGINYYGDRQAALDTQNKIQQDGGIAEIFEADVSSAEAVSQMFDLAIEIKDGMASMTKTLALEYVQDNIRVNAIAPGATITPINSWADDPQKRQEIANFIPMQRLGNPEEMAEVTAFLASDTASYITGQTLFVDGGLTLYPAFQQPWVT